MFPPGGEQRLAGAATVGLLIQRRSTGPARCCCPVPLCPPASRCTCLACSFLSARALRRVSSCSLPLAALPIYSPDELVVCVSAMEDVSRLPRSDLADWVCRWPCTPTSQNLKKNISYLAKKKQLPRFLFHSIDLDQNFFFVIVL